MLADSSHRVSFFIHSFLCVGIPLLIWDWQCVMIMGNNPLTAVHVARDVEIIDREAFIMDLDENPAHPGGMLICFVQCLPTAHFFLLVALVWRTVDSVYTPSITISFHNTIPHARSPPSLAHHHRRSSTMP